MINILKEFDRFLGEKRLKYSGIVIGATALKLMGVINRFTKDVDCLTPLISEEIKQASKKFAKQISSKLDVPLSENWFNNGPDSLVRDLPPDWEKRVAALYTGKNLILHTLGRSDLLKSKLFAFCDRQQDLQDCMAMKPDLAELQDSFDWLIQRDGNPNWPEHVMQSLKTLAKELNYEFNPRR